MAETREMKADDASALYPTNNTQSNGSPYQGMNISENNMEMINQDEHLRTLLKPRSKEHRTSQTSGYCSSSGLSLSDGGTSSCITLQSVQRDSAEKEAASGSGGSQCSSEQNLSDGSTNNKDFRKCNVYKFKHNITKRFSEEGKPFLLKSDTSSNDSREEDVEHSKQKVFSYRMDSPCTDSTPYPSSEISSGTNCLVENINLLDIKIVMTIVKNALIPNRYLCLHLFYILWELTTFLLLYIRPISVPYSKMRRKHPRHTIQSASPLISVDQVSQYIHKWNRNFCVQVKVMNDPQTILRSYLETESQTRVCLSCPIEICCDYLSILYMYIILTKINI